MRLLAIVFSDRNDLLATYFIVCPSVNAQKISNSRTLRFCNESLEDELISGLINFSFLQRLLMQ